MSIFWAPAEEGNERGGRGGGGGGRMVCLLFLESIVRLVLGMCFEGRGFVCAEREQEVR